MVAHWQKSSSNLAKIETSGVSDPKAGFITGSYSGQPQFFDWQNLRYAFASSSPSYYQYFDHYLGAIANPATPGNIQVDLSGTGTTVVASNALTLTSGATATNHTTIALGLDFLVSNGFIVFDARFKIGTTAGTIVEVGLSDALSETAGEAFSDHTVPGITAIATDAIVVAFEDTAVTNWTLNYVNTDSETGVDLAVAPVDDTYVTVKIVVNDVGGAQVWLNGTLVSTISAAVASTAVLTPWVTVKAIGAAAETVSLDYLGVVGSSGL